MDHLNSAIYEFSHDYQLDITDANLVLRINRAMGILSLVLSIRKLRLPFRM